MTNIETIIFNTKYNIKYMNGKYSISGFSHMKSIRISEDRIYKVLDENGLCYFDEEDWNEFVKLFKND